MKKMCALGCLLGLTSTVLAVGPMPLGTKTFADVEQMSWLLMLGGFLVELVVMYFLLGRDERFVKIFGVTIFMNAASIFMGTVSVYGVDSLVTHVLQLPMIVSYSLIYFAAVATSVFTEVLIVKRIFPRVNLLQLIIWLTLANVTSIAAGMYGIWMTRLPQG